MKQASTFAILALALGLSVPAVAQEGCGVTATVTLTLPTCGEYSNGAVTINASGGEGGYTYYLNGIMLDGPTATGLIPGVYTYYVEDAVKKCPFNSEFTLGCEPPKVSCNFRSQTQGGWGAPPNGNNPAMYLQNHFAGCFPNGITIGCASNNTLTLTTSVAVKNFLPSGSTASQLPSDKVNPGTTYNNVLAGQLVAAVINVTVDACDPSFGESDGWLGDATYVSGPFAGWSVSEVIDAANQFIGGCGGSYSASQFNTALTNLNENYHGGTTNNGKLICEGKEEEKSLSPTTASTMELRAYPNPATETATVQVRFSAPGTATLVVLDVSGRTVAQQRLQADAAGMRSAGLDLSNIGAGTYLVQVQLNGSTSTTKLVVNK